MLRAFVRTESRFCITNVARMPIMAMTTRSSISVNPLSFFERGLT